MNYNFASVYSWADKQEQTGHSCSQVRTPGSKSKKTTEVQSDAWGRADCVICAFFDRSVSGTRRCARLSTWPPAPPATFVRSCVNIYIVQVFHWAAWSNICCWHGNRISEAPYWSCHNLLRRPRQQKSTVEQCRSNASTCSAFNITFHLKQHKIFIFPLIWLTFSPRGRMADAL